MDPKSICDQGLHAGLLNVDRATNEEAPKDLSSGFGSFKISG